MPLTPEQCAVIDHPSGHAKVMAVAGAGKTTTLVYYVRQCLARGINPRRLLILMYNKAAQVDFQKKLNQLLDKDRRENNLISPEVRTFHSLGLKIYKQLIASGHLKPFNDKLLSDSEIEGVVWKLLQACADPETAKDILDQRSKWVEPAVNYIDLVKSSLRSPEDVFEQSGLPAQCRFFSQVFHKFERWRKDQSRISYSDMLYDPCCLFKRFPDVANKFSGHMQQFIVDEYQDINEIQQFLLTTLRGSQGDVMVVGDPDQTIYEFRGSRPEFMTTEFDNDFSGVSLYNLSHTFRYGHRLSLLCNYLISHNPDRKGVLCVSESTNPHTKLSKVETTDTAKAVVKLIKEQLEKTLPTQIAILNRIWAISAPIELALLEEGISYQLDHSVSVLDKRELAPFEALLLVASGQYPHLAIDQRVELLTTLLTEPFPKIRRKQLTQMAAMAAQFGNEPGKAIRQVMPETLSNRQADQILARSRLLDQALTDRFTSGQLLQKYYSITEMEEGIRESAFSSQQIDDRLETVKAFLRYMRGLELASKSGWQYWQDLRTRRLNNKEAGIRLTSMHRSKGLEWDCVIIPALSDRFMPYRAEGELAIPASVESERRLMYVAMTRAKKHLFLVVPDLNGAASKQKAMVSPFIGEMGFDTADLVGATIEKRSAHEIPINQKHYPIAQEYAKQSGISLNLAGKLIENYEAHTKHRHYGAIKPRDKVTTAKVRHQVYGEGLIISDERRYWVIRFSGGVEKQFDKRVAAQYLEFL